MDALHRTKIPHDLLAGVISTHTRVQGVVARIERLAVHDGPGIRTVVFLKGCPLICSWCSSPETRRQAPELFFDRRRCIRCGACLPDCPAGAVFDTEDGAFEIDRSLCEGCGRCVRVCPSGARRLVGTTFTVAGILGEIEKDEVFYYRSGGGVTISGGEPLAQPAFTAGILRACAARGIHTAMETSAYAAWDCLTGLLDMLDLIYVDVKHMDDAVHRRMTGVGNRRILENIRKLMRAGSRPVVIVRIPVIPGINDTAENLEQTAGFCAALADIERVELLAYHRYGLHSYAATGRPFGLAGVETPSDDRMQALADFFGSRGIGVRIGG